MSKIAQLLKMPARVLWKAKSRHDPAQQAIAHDLRDTAILLAFMALLFATPALDIVAGMMR